jgi:signal transduction histidine kinase
MTLPHRLLLPAQRARFELFGDTLSGRVLWMTVAIIMLVESAVLLPLLGSEREKWLSSRVEHAHLATYALAQIGGNLPQATQDQMLAMAKVEQIRLLEPGRAPLVISGSQPVTAVDQQVDLASESLAISTWRALRRLFNVGGRQIEITAPSPLEPGAIVDVIANGDELNGQLRSYAKNLAIIAAIVALVTGLLVYAVLDRLLVRPLQIITNSINGFRRDPTQESETDLAWLAQQTSGEAAEAARELKIMQDEMRTALWRNARLAAVGTSVAKISHDLRNILSSALLVADRLQAVQDPVVQRATRRLIPAVERAAELVASTVSFAREGPPAITRSAVRLREVVDEAVGVACPDGGSTRIDNQVPENLVLSLDQTQIYRVLVNLMRNASEAGAETIQLTTDVQGGVTRLRVADNGPGLPLRVQDNLFKPFTSSAKYGGSGLGLAIARDLVRAHGGDLVLEQTGPRGTVFIMDLPLHDA